MFSRFPNSFTQSVFHCVYPFDHHAIEPPERVQGRPHPRRPSASAAAGTELREAQAQRMSSTSEERHCHPGAICSGGFVSSLGPPPDLSNSGLLLFPPVTLLFCWEIKPSDHPGIQHEQMKLEGLKLFFSPKSSFLIVCSISWMLSLASPRKVWGQEHQRGRWTRWTKTHWFSCLHVLRNLGAPKPNQEVLRNSASHALRDY
uniref:Uncharacterized protein n=1 Tax=Molossus molossus TaxID=27622 RepID=A0A7J8GQ25_MOLMO|nr:hypothetical protein HJG59_011280 [Molossus molossus]